MYIKPLRKTLLDFECTPHSNSLKIHAAVLDE
jgi:hypothetical protein